MAKPHSTPFREGGARSRELQEAVTRMAAAGIEERGAVYTRREVVEFILDLADYRSDLDLTHARLLEPACGRGDFLMVAVSRLLDSFVARGGDLTHAVHMLSGAVRGVELHRETHRAVQQRVRDLLIERGVPAMDAVVLAATWLVHDDFLLADLPGDFTHVVGNPPYVRQERIPDVLLRQYRARYATMYDRADLYVPFIERGLTLLAPHGRLAFICADRWLKNRYGGPLRALITRDFHLAYYVDMTGTDAFHSEVSAYPAIVVITREMGAQTRVVKAPMLDDARAVEALLATILADRDETRPASATTARTGDVDTAVLPGEDGRAPVIMLVEVKGAKPWALQATTDERALLHRLEHDYRPLEAEGCKVGIGVATGCDDVYIGRLDELPVEDDRKLPLIMAPDIRTGRIEWNNTGLINPFLDSGALVPLAEYPRLAAYFSEHEQALRGRHVAKNRPTRWYRTIDRIYPALTTVPKLLIPDIKGGANVVYDGGHYYPHHNLYYVTSTTWDLRALQALLRSSIARLFVASYTVKMRGGYLRFQAQYIRRIHVPAWASIPEAVRERLRAAARDNDLAAADEATCDAYGLTAAERSLMLRARSVDT